MDYEVTNMSTLYDGEVTISCTIPENDYVKVDYEPKNMTVAAGGTKSGQIRAKLTRTSVEEGNISISCELITNAAENTELFVPTYSFSALMLDSSNNALPNTNLVIYSDTPHYVTTDDIGYFEISGLEQGRHEVYAIKNKTLEEIRAMYKETVISNATQNINLNLDEEVTVEESDNCKLNSLKSANDLTGTLPAKKLVYIISGDGMTPGNEIDIVGERFYVVEKRTDNRLVLLGKANINETTGKQSGAGTQVASTSLKQGIINGTSYTYTVAQSIDINRVLKKYEDYFRSSGISSMFDYSASARIFSLITEEQARKYSSYARDNYRYWIGKTYSTPFTVQGTTVYNEGLYYVSNGSIQKPYASMNAGVRPLAVVRIEILNK